MSTKRGMNGFAVGVIAGWLLVAGSSPVFGGDDRDGKQRPKKPPKLAIDRQAPPLTIAFISYANPQHVAKNSEAITKYLEAFVGVPVKGFVTTDYGSSVETMRSGQTDLAFVDPLAFLMAHEQIGAKPLLL